MTCTFSITIDRPRMLIRIAMGGFFDVADVEALRDELRTKIETLGLPLNEHRTLCDVSQMAIQAQDVVGAFAQIVGSPDLQAKRLAFIVGSTLARMQTRRLTDRANVRLFKDADAAEAWLLVDQSSSSPALAPHVNVRATRF